MITDYQKQLDLDKEFVQQVVNKLKEASVLLEEAGKIVNKRNMIGNYECNIGPRFPFIDECEDYEDDLMYDEDTGEELDEDEIGIPGKIMQQYHNLNAMLSDASSKLENGLDACGWSTSSMYC